MCMTSIVVFSLDSGKGYRKVANTPALSGSTRDSAWRATLQACNFIFLSALYKTMPFTHGAGLPVCGKRKLPAPYSDLLD
ncbi:hypothetical protein C2U69_34160 [Cupriavidus pinatubonensis]|nr:hypothetical protein C2U69_34160 [Cupriavidus pinatubonensis]